jgi:hypothetical protein
MKKLIKRKEDSIYVKVEREAAYCDFCGEEDVQVFESEFEHENGAKSDMQICFQCVRQLNAMFDKEI